MTKNVYAYNMSSFLINLQDTMNRIEILISSTKEIDMCTNCVPTEVYLIWNKTR